MFGSRALQHARPGFAASTDVDCVRTVVAGVKPGTVRREKFFKAAMDGPVTYGIG